MCANWPCDQQEGDMMTKAEQAIKTMYNTFSFEIAKANVPADDDRFYTLAAAITLALKNACELIEGED